MAGASAGALSRAISSPSAPRQIGGSGAGAAASVRRLGRFEDLAGAIQHQPVLERPAQGPERADHAVAVAPDHAGLAPPDVLPVSAVEGGAVDRDLLDLVAELHDHAGPHVLRLERRGMPVERPVGEEALERQPLARRVAKALEQGGEELLGGVGAAIAHGGDPVVLHEPRDQVEQGGAAARREPARLEERRDEVGPRVVERLEERQRLARRATARRAPSARRGPSRPTPGASSAPGSMPSQRPSGSRHLAHASAPSSRQRHAAIRCPRRSNWSSRRRARPGA